MKSDEPLFKTFYAKSVKGFLNYLTPSAGHWKCNTYGDLAFRGQGSSSWPLIPAAFRKSILNDKSGRPIVAKSGYPTRVIPQSDAEYRAVSQFIRAVDTVGLRITNAGQLFLSRNDPRIIFGEEWANEWPRTEIMEPLALAQHYGVPTRLLDFTENPLVASYFAAQSALSSMSNEGSDKNKSTSLAVWVVDLRFIRTLIEDSWPDPERIAEVRVPRAENSFLHAQSGFFIYDRGANDLMTQRSFLTIDGAISDRSISWKADRERKGKPAEGDWFDDPPIRKARLHVRHAPELLRELSIRGITQESLMPSLDLVINSLNFRSRYEIS